MDGGPAQAALVLPRGGVPPLPPSFLQPRPGPGSCTHSQAANPAIHAEPSRRVLRCDVQGRVVMKCFLSGMPDVKLGLNDSLEDVTFHPCVNLGRFQAEQVVSFVPPDGEFELMKYRCTGREAGGWAGGWALGVESCRGTCGRVFMD